MFNSLSEKLENVFKKLKSRGVLREEDVKAAMREIKLSLLEADVNFKVVKEFIDNVTKRAVGKEVIKSVTPGQQVVKIVHDELCELLGRHQSKLELAPNPPTIIMLAGLQGSGKTTSAAKLAMELKKGDRKVMLVALDTQRPAAIDQLKTLGSQVNVSVYGTQLGDNPVTVCKSALKEAKKQFVDVMILDTAGRLHIDEPLMVELKEIKKEATPHEILFVADAMTGQDAVNIAQSFNERLEITGVILTKIDGDARGGAALSIASVTGKPLKFLGTGEKIEPLEPFHPDRITSRILGMGDIVTLVEKAQEAISIDEALKLEKKLKEDSFSYNDLKQQIRQIRKMGPLENILGMIPGLGKQLKGVNVDEKEFVKVEAIINSMTKKERNNAVVLSASRKRRIAKGSGTTVSDVNRLIKQYTAMRKMMKKFKKGKMPFNLGFN